MALFPRPLSSFVGRDSHAREIQRLIAEHRLLTLVGLPGVGKTRLALEVAARFAGELRVGAFVDVAPLGEKADVLGALAAICSVEAVPGRPSIEAVTAHLRLRAQLVILDNCEHLLAACGEVCALLLAACPSLSVLATSREPLGVAGETVSTVRPLALPSPGSPPEAAIASEAVRLFVDRASTRDPGFAASPAVASRVAEICRRLDGVPLAIELAADWVGVLSLSQIISRLDDSLTLLGGGSRDNPGRHRSLVDALERSHQLLDTEERVLLRRLAVFADGMTLEAIEDVTAGEDLPRSQVLPTLARLVAKSLVTADVSGGDARYRLLAIIRQYAGRSLAGSGEEAAIRTAHLEWCVGLAASAERPLEGSEQPEWLDRMELERENLRAALEWALEAGDPDRALRLATALSPVWLVRGDLEDGLRWLEQALARARKSGSPMLIARALHDLGRAARSRGDPEAAAALHHEALGIQRGIVDIGGMAASLEALAGLATDAGSGDRAARLFGAASALRDRGHQRTPGEQASYDSDMARARRAFAPEDFERAWTRGTRLSAEAAAEYSTRGPGRQRPSTGWPSLTPAERQVAQLAADGLTNREIGARLCVSPRTVQNHLAHIFTKLGISSRRKLREAQGASNSGNSGTARRPKPHQR